MIESTSKRLCIVLLLASVAPVAADEVTQPQDLPEVQAIVREYEIQAAEIARKADAELQIARDKSMEKLRALRDTYTRAAKLDEAIVVRDMLRGMEVTWKAPSTTLSKAVVAAGVGVGLSEIQDDPGSFTNTTAKAGDVMYFKVTGADVGSLYGSDVYTSDSRLAKAAVHAGVLRFGETGVVKVTILPGRSTYEGSTRNDLTSSSWTIGWDKSYRVEPIGTRKVGSETKATVNE
jgi:hypothetical protein